MMLNRPFILARLNLQGYRCLLYPAQMGKFKARCYLKNSSFFKNYRFLVFTCFVKFSISTVMKINTNAETTGNGLKLRLKNTGWLLKAQKSAVF